MDGASEPEKLINAEGGKSKTWPERKAHTIDFIKNAGRDMKLLSCADKLANIRDIIRDYDRLGDGVWDIFNASKDSVAWYYRSMLDQPNPPSHHCHPISSPYCGIWVSGRCILWVIHWASSWETPRGGAL